VRLDVTLPAGAVGTSVLIRRLDPDGRRTPVRLADPAVVTGSAWVGYDYEAPYGVSCTYAAQVVYWPASRANAITNPNFETDVFGWAATSGATITQDTAKYWSGAASMRLDTTAAGQSAYHIASVSSASVSPVIASAYVQGTSGGMAYIRLQFSNGSTVDSSPVTLTGSWQRISVAGVSPTGCTNVKVQIFQVSTGAQSMWIDGVLTEESASTGAYFDGATTDTSTLFYDWAGVANASTSYEHLTGTTTADDLTAAATLAVTDVWLIHPGVPDLSMRLAKVKSLGDRTRWVNWGVFQPFGRPTPVVVTDGRRKAVTAQLVIRTRTLDELDALVALTTDAAVLLLNVPASLGWGVTNEYISLGDLTESREAFASFPTRVLSAPYLVVSRPVGGSQSQRTYADLLTECATYQAVMDLYDTYLDALAPTV